MEQFIKERIGFSLALLAVVLALHPFVKDNPDFGFTVLNIPFLVKHFFISGIIYWSSAKRNGKNIVLFKGPDISIRTQNDQNVQWLKYKGSKDYRINEIIVNSIKILKSNNHL